MTKKVKSFKTDTVPVSQMIMRMVSVRAETANEETKSVQVVVASENPVERFDDERGEVYREILSMDGIEFRGASKQLPIVDSHNRSTVRNVLGSVRNIRIEGSQLIGDAMFARDSDSQEAFQKLLDGHLTDFSITATPRNTQAVRRGETAMFRNAEVTGPAVIVTHWTPTDASLVAAGADETSTVRSELLRSYQVLQREIKRMSPETQAALVAKGMPSDIEDAEAALTWLLGSSGAAPAVEEPLELADEMQVEEETKPEEIVSMDDEEKKPEEIKSAVTRALQAESKRRKEIVALCNRAGIERAFADNLCDSNVSLNNAREKVLERMVTKPLGTSVGGERISVTASAEDKFEKAVHHGLIMRTMTRAKMAQIERDGNKVYNPFGEGGKPAEGAQDFSNLSLIRMAEQVLIRGGIQTNRMTSRQIALAAMGHEPTLRGMRIQRDAYHTTGTFSNILLDAANKSLLAGYEEATFTWDMWARQAPSVPDFKTINRTRFSESPDLEEIPENEPYPEGKMSDEKESYKVAKFGRVFSTTWETIVNDDLDAISRIPAMHGNAARRVQNKKVYQVLTDNAAMSDGVALFHSTHANHSGGAAAVSNTTLNAMYVSMMKQTGLGGNIIGVMPKYIIGPPSTSAAIIVLLTSMSDPAVGGSAAGNSNVQGLYGKGGSRTLIPVIEPQLEAASTTTWYAAADYNQTDTVELTFLQGEESPVIESEWDFDRDGWKSKIRQTFGVKAIDYRGLYTNQA